MSYGSIIQTQAGSGTKDGNLSSKTDRQDRRKFKIKRSRHEVEAVIKMMLVKFGQSTK